MAHLPPHADVHASIYGAVFIFLSKKVKIKEKVTVENPTNQWWGSETRPGGKETGEKGQVIEREKGNGKKQNKGKKRRKQDF